MLRTTKATLDEVYLGFTCRQIAEDIYGCHADGVRAFDPYIWIDALCIVLDDPQEWEGEGLHAWIKCIGGSQLTISAVNPPTARRAAFTRHQQASQA